MSRLLALGRLALGLLLLAAAPAAAQYDPARVAELLPAGGPLRNLVENLHAEGDTLWAGPLLVFTPDGGRTWEAVNDEKLTPAHIPGARVYSLDVRGEDVWVGLGYRDPAILGSPQSAGGFAHSPDGGRTWSYHFPQLDLPEDTLQAYGCNYFTPEQAESGNIHPIAGCEVLALQLPALPIIVPQQSPPFDIAFDPVRRDLWVAGWASGIRRLRWLEAEGRYAQDFERVVLPPDTLREIRPDRPYGFALAPQRFDFEEANNFLGFSVLVDETGTVWAGTVAGVNRSRPEDVFLFEDTETGEVFEERAWRRFAFDGTHAGLLGNWVIALEEQPLEGARNPVWMVTWRALQQQERFGLMVTRDGGESFEAALVGERLYGLGFCGAGFAHCAEGTVYAAGDRGLFISEDGGSTWRSVTDFRDRERPGRFVVPGSTAYAVAATPEALWVGTADGLLRSTDGAQTWTLFRADVPASPEAPTPSAPDAEVYAYPNPFSPHADGYVRIRYEREASQIRIFDFAMNLVRTIAGPAPLEQVWDGYGDDGNRVANGVYLYAVEAGGRTLWGKILVLE